MQCSAVVSFNEPYNFQYVSQSLCEMLDLMPEELLGRSVKILQGPSTNAAAFGAAIKNALLQQPCTVPLTTYCRDGSQCDVKITCSAHAVNDGVVDGVILIFVPLDVRDQFSYPLRCGFPVKVPETRISLTRHIVAPATPGHSIQSPEPFSLAARNLRGSARARYNRTVGRELAVSEGGETIEGDTELLDALFSDFAAQ